MGQTRQASKMMFIMPDRMKSSIRLKKSFRDLNMSGIDVAAYAAATKGL